MDPDDRIAITDLICLHGHRVDAGDAATTCSPRTSRTTSPTSAAA